ncbi:SUMF1/EgtB/PvdO family nonheme iron enzyme [Chondromyces crocatus]|uniref:Protein kinase n=1 Tax=Chondromyces crocatus TaxID=52 RepID=A0A0K1EBQ7_CHOCO|nr:SUMF1/EgtB/PvdO family nonheme iron enzyme [Chondromyces crocatus]AKT38300.1 protein kinase [Chondromyces crocatus]
MVEPPASGDPFQLSGHVIEGKYRVASVVGDGGFGVVYRAVHKGFGELIAVKCLKMPALDEKEREELLELLREEGRLLHRLSRLTPNIVQALDVGAFTTDTGTWIPYLVLEWLEGQTLAQFMRERHERDEYGMPLDEAMRLLEPAARALAVAHSQRVAHRDVKPANLFLTDVGGTRTLKVLDFGIAKVLTDVASFTEALAATRDGPSAFTPRYGAPEQFSKMRGATGPWTDVFALALILVELVSGRRALDGDDPTQLYIAAADPHLRPSLRSRGVEVDEVVERVLLKALAVEPKDRYVSAGEMWDALTAAVKEAGAAGAVWLGGAASGVATAGPRGNGDSGPTGSGSTPRAPSMDAPAFDATIPAESLDASSGRAGGNGSGQGNGAVSSGQGARGQLSSSPSLRAASTVKHGAGSRAALDDSMLETPRGLRIGDVAQADRDPSASPPATPAPSAGGAGSAAAPKTTGAASSDASTGRRIWPWIAVLALIGGSAATYLQLTRDPARAPANPRPTAPRPTASASASARNPLVAPTAAPEVPPVLASASPEPTTSASAAPPFVPPEDMVLFQPGTVVFGAGADQRQVTLTRGFFLDRSEVTTRAYQACVAERLCSPADHVSVTPEQTAEGSTAAPVDREYVDTWTRRCNAARGEGNHPVNCVDYASAESYCRYRGRRLPTEAEWELAARGTTQRAFPWGNDEPTCDRACYDRNEACRKIGVSVATCAAGTHPGDRTPEGIQDLAGNLAEWVSDGFSATPPSGVDPKGDPASPLKIVRGGSFFDDATKLSTLWRTVAAPVTAAATIGFRCALDAPETPPAP